MAQIGLTPEQIIAQAMRARGLPGPTVPRVPMLPGVPQGVDAGGSPAPSSGGFNLDQALMPPDWLANKPPSAGDPIADIFRKSFSTDWGGQPGQQPPTPRPRPIGPSPQMNYDAPQPDPMRQMNYGELPQAAAGDPNAIPMADQPPMPMTRPAPPMARPAPRGATPQGQPGPSQWPPMPQARPEFAGLPPEAAAALSNAQPEGITSGGDVAALGAGMTPGTMPSAPQGGGADPAQAGGGLWDRIKNITSDPNFNQNLVNFGMATMAAADRPGASFLGAVGSGGLGAMQQADRTRRLDIQQQQANRQEKRDERRMTLEERKLIQDADLARERWAEQSTRADLDRAARVDAANQARELKRWQVELQAGNAQAANEIRALIGQTSVQTRQDTLEQRKAEADQRAADRAAERDRRETQDAENRQARIDNQAAEAARRHVEVLRDKATGRLPPEAAQAEDDFIRKNFPKSTRAQDLLAMPAELPTAEVEVAPASMMPSYLGGTPAQTRKQVDRKALIKGQTYVTPQGPMRFNGTDLEPVQ